MLISPDLWWFRLPPARSFCWPPRACGGGRPDRAWAAAQLAACNAPVVPPRHAVGLLRPRNACVMARSKRSSAYRKEARSQGRAKQSERAACLCMCCCWPLRTGLGQVLGKRLLLKCYSPNQAVCSTCGHASSGGTCCLYHGRMPRFACTAKAFYDRLQRGPRSAGRLDWCQRVKRFALWQL